MIKYKNGHQCLVSDFDWENMSNDDKKKYSDHPAGAEIQAVSLGADGQPEYRKIEFKGGGTDTIIKKVEIKDKKDGVIADQAKQIADLQKAIEDLAKANMPKEIEDVGISAPVNPHEIEDIEKLRAWLTENKAEYPGTVKRIETLRKYIPEGHES